MYKVLHYLNFLINELPDILSNISDYVYLDNGKLSCLLYAYGLVLTSDLKNGLQRGLDILCAYCKD